MRYKTYSSEKLVAIKSWSTDTDRLYGPPIKRTRAKNKGKTKGEQVKSKNFENEVVVTKSATDKLHSNKLSALGNASRVTNEKNVKRDNLARATTKNNYSGSNKTEHDEKNNIIRNNNISFLSSSKVNGVSLGKVKKEKKVQNLKLENTAAKRLLDLDMDELEEDPDDEFFDYQPATEEELEKFFKSEASQFNNSKNKLQGRVDDCFSFILEQPLHAREEDLERVRQASWPFKAFPSISTILQATMPPENAKRLEEWRRKMLLKLGEKDFERLQRETLERGRLFHETLNAFLLGRGDLQVPLSIKKHWKSVEWVLRGISDVKCTEAAVESSRLKYRGIVDCVASYQGVPCVIEWKTSKRSKPSIHDTFDNPLQLVAYMAAYNESSLLSSPPSHQPTPPPSPVGWGLLVVGHEDGSEADMHQMHPQLCSLFWSHWIRRLHLYWTSFQQPLIHPSLHQSLIHSSIPQP